LVVKRFILVILILFGVACEDTTTPKFDRGYIKNYIQRESFFLIDTRGSKTLCFFFVWSPDYNHLMVKIDCNEIKNEYGEWVPPYEIIGRRKR